MKKLDEKVLIIDDEDDWLDLLGQLVRDFGFSAVTAHDAEEALVHLGKEKVFLILADLILPGMDGIELCKHVRAKGIDLPFILVSAKADRERAIESLRAGVTDVIDKPFHNDTIQVLLNNYSNKRLEQIEIDRKEAETLLAIFLDEARDQMIGIEESLLRLEDEPGNFAEIDRLFRNIHTIKGSSGSTKKTEHLTPLAHAIEGLLARIKEKSIRLNGAIIDTLLNAVDFLSLQLKAIENDEVGPDVGPIIKALKDIEEAPIDQSMSDASPSDMDARSHEQESETGVYVSTEKLDSFMEMCGELIAVKNAFYMFTRESGYLTEAGLTSAKDISNSLEKVTDRIQSQLMEIRKVSLKKLFAKLPRIVRQINTELHKEAVLEMHGEDVTVDKTIANMLSGCLSHAVRNALDHGLESHEERLAKGKPVKGRIVVKAVDLVDEISISIADDGRGIDRQAVLEKAIRMKLLDEEQANQLSEQEILRFIFHSGFSTASKVTSISGRGVGMDAIQSAVQTCGGDLLIESKLGQGTTITITLPVLKTVNVVHAILVESNETFYAIPLKNVSAVSNIRSQQLTPIKNFMSFQYRGKSTRVASYAELQSSSSQLRHATWSTDDEDRLVVIISNQEEQFGLLVDRVVGQLDAVIRPFNKLISDLRGFEGTAVIGNGKIAYVVAADELIALANNSSRELIAA